MSRKRSEDEAPTRTTGELWREFFRSKPSAEVRDYVRKFSRAFNLAPSLYKFGKRQEKL